MELVDGVFAICKLQMNLQVCNLKKGEFNSGRFIAIQKKYIFPISTMNMATYDHRTTTLDTMSVVSNESLQLSGDIISIVLSEIDFDLTF